MLGDMLPAIANRASLTSVWDQSTCDFMSMLMPEGLCCFLWVVGCTERLEPPRGFWVVDLVAVWARFYVADLFS
jgi:hypothetical protein